MMPSTPFTLISSIIPLVVAMFALAMAAFPRRMTRWQARGPDGTTQIEPGRTRLLVMRVMGVVVAGLALLMAFGTSMVFL